MELTILEYDQEGGYMGVRELARLFAEGWETVEPLKFHACCGIYRTVLGRKTLAQG